VGKTRAHANAPSLKPLNHRLSIVENYDPHWSAEGLHTKEQQKCYKEELKSAFSEAPVGNMLFQLPSIYIFNYLQRTTFAIGSMKVLVDPLHEMIFEHSFDDLME
jgi:hypothetical protein